MVNWISCDDRLPLELSDYHRDSVEVIVTDGESVSTCVFCRGYIPFEWRDWSKGGIVDRYKITHWQPLPEPPVE